MPGSARRIILGLLILFAALNAVRLACFPRAPIDFPTYYNAAVAIVHGEPVYPRGGVHGDYYVYPQGFALALTPLALLGRNAAERAWMLINFLAAFAIAILAALSLPPPHGKSRMYIPLALLAAAAFGPLWFGWRIGQADILVTLPIAAGLAVGGKKWKPVAAGVGVGFATIFKLSPLLLVPALVLAFGWRFAAAFAATIALYVAVLLVGGWWSEEVYLFTHLLGNHPFKSSLHSLFCVQLFPDWLGSGSYGGGWAGKLITWTMLAAYAVTGLLAWLRTMPWLSLLAIGVAFSHLASPFLEPHHFTLVLVVLVPWLLKCWERPNAKGAWIPIAIACIGGVFLQAYEIIPMAASYALLLIDALLIGGAFYFEEPVRIDEQ